MIFRMGADDRVVKNMLAGGRDFREPLCRTSYGIALDEPLEMKRERARRLYVFNDRSWSESSVRELQERWLQ